MNAATGVLPQPGSDLEQRLIRELTAWRADATALVIGPGDDAPAFVAYVARLLGEQPTRSGGLAVFRLQPASR